jgi:hypothetical protein
VARFALALRFLAEHPDLRVEMGARGRAFVERNCSRERLLSDVAKLYRALFSEGYTDRKPAPSESQPLEEAQALSIDRVP